jgi:hypothetical protein
VPGPLHVRRLLSRTAVALVLVGTSLTPAQSHGSVAAAELRPDGAGAGRHHHYVGPAPVAPPPVEAPGPLPVPKAPAVRVSGVPSPAAVTDQVALRALVIAVDPEDWGAATWKSTLDRVGAGYDVVYSRNTPLTASTLLRPDGTGKYNAILLTNNAQVYFDGGAITSGLDADEWNRLWAYERDFGVRQASLYTSYGTWPEDYCLRPVGEGGVGDTPLNASLTTAGAAVFDYLKPTAQIPITQSYVYRTALADDCAADPVLAAGDDVLGVRTTAADGRERIALTFTSNQYLLQADLLVYGVFRWASRGLFLGEQRHFFNVDIDDWFNTSDHLFPDGHLETDPGFQVSAHDAYNLDQRLRALRAQHPLAGDFTLNLAYNGGDADLTAPSQCFPDGGVDELTATSKCLAGQFRWINHTASHPELNFTDHTTSFAEVQGNLTIADALGLPVPASVLKTGEYSGLGVYNPDPNNDVDPPTDHGLAASNPQFLAAAKDAGVTHVHGNMSFASHQPSCFNCAIVHPLEPAVSIVPDWPTNIAYHTTTPEEETFFYNSFYGPAGRFPFWSSNREYQEILDYEAGIALQHISSGSVYTHTLHIANVRDYAEGSTVTTDWLGEVLAKYSALYAVPLLNPDWPSLARYASARTVHFAGLTGGTEAVYDRTAGTIVVTAPAAATVTVSGARTAQSSTYGTDVSAPVTVDAGGAVTVPASPRA